MSGLIDREDEGNALDDLSRSINSTDYTRNPVLLREFEQALEAAEIALRMQSKQVKTEEMNSEELVNGIKRDIRTRSKEENER